MSKVSFRTNALLKSIIGKDLITDDNIAVLELVKNSFDAGSKNVNLIFENIIKNEDYKKQLAPTKNSSKLVIQDFGVGMSESDLKDPVWYPPPAVLSLFSEVPVPVNLYNNLPY